jgi:CDP-glucose 4,6-dehydratase
MNFWHGKKVLVTGHTGFKGGWLSLWLQHLNANLVGLALPPVTTPSLFKLANVGEGMQSIMADIRNLNALKQAFIHHQPEIVFHLAAQPLVRHSYENPVETYATNVLGTVHLMESVRAVESVKVVVNITTDKCYENNEWCWGYRENDRLGGFDPYSNSKACAELVTSAYRDSFMRQKGIGLATARAGNVIGGGDWAKDRLIPDIIHGCMQKEAIAIRHPAAIRPWQHVLEPLGGYLRLAEALYHDPLKYSEAWNFGPNEEDARPVSWIADYITRQWSDSAQWVQEGGEHPHEANYLKLDCSKAKSRLGFKPQYDLSKSLAQTIAWYKAYLAGEEMKHFTMAQIQQFINQPIHQKRETNHVYAEVY